jgi:hypothetical protein
MKWYDAHWKSQLFDKVRDHPADIYGFQECEDVSSTVSKAGLRDYEVFQGPNKGEGGNPAPLAWNSKVFQKLTEPEDEWIASDQYGNRYANVVRLRHKASGATVTFSNTHGPLGNCKSSVGDNWVKSFNTRKQDGDVVIMTGDFNCKPGETAINKVEAFLGQRVHHWVDFIFTTSSTISGGHHDGWPSDHALLEAEIDIGSGPPPGAGGSDGSDGSESNDDSGGSGGSDGSDENDGSGSSEIIFIGLGVQTCVSVCSVLPLVLSAALLHSR